MTTLDQAIQLRKDEHYEEALVALQALRAKSPNDPVLNYQCAWTCDAQGKEGAAVPYYEAALANGLTGEDRRSALLGLGSTFRCLGKYDRSLQVLEDGIRQFPEYRALRVFHALTLYNLQRPADAVGALLTELVETTSDSTIKAYGRALTFYSDKLDQTRD